MPATVGHVLSATTPDDTNYEIRPSHWNSAHAVTLNISGTDISGAFSNANGISFGTSNNGQLTASYTVPAAGNPNFSAGTTSSALGSVVFSNSNGVGFGLNGSTITASYTVPGATVFSNSNNVSFGLNGSTVTATITVPAQTNQTAGVYASSQTFGQSSSSTYDARSLSVVGSGGVSVGWSNSSLLISGTTYPAQSVQPVAASAAGGSVAFSTLSFSNLNNVSFITAAGPAIQGSFALNVSATGGTSNALSGLTFKDSQGVSFGLSTGAGIGTITASVLSQSNQTGGIYVLTSTVGDSSSSTYDMRSLSLTFQSAGLLSGGWTNGSLQLGARFKMSAGASSANVASVTFSNSNNVTFGMSTGALAGTFTGSYALNVSATGGTSVGLSGLTFKDSNGVSFGLSTGVGVGTLTASVLPETVSTCVPLWPASTSSLLINVLGVSSANAVFFPYQVDNFLSFNMAAILQSYSFVPATLSAASATEGVRFGLYSNNASTWSLISSGSSSIGITNSGISVTISYPTATSTSGYGYNTTSSSITLGIESAFGTLGFRNPIMQFGGNMSLTPGWYAIGMVSTASSSSTNIGINQALIGNVLPVSNMFGMGQSTTVTNQMLGMGYATATTSGLPASMAFSNLTNSLGIIPLITIMST